MKNDYRNWLEKQKYQTNTINSQMHRVSRVEEHYGDLDEGFEKDQLAEIIKSLSYSAKDKRDNLPNPSKIPFDGNPYTNLASYRDAVNRYKKFRLDDTILMDEEDVLNETTSSINIGKQSISLERDMQFALRTSIEQLESSLMIVDDGAERSVESGFIDITAEDADGTTVVIELKTGVAGQKAIAQILSYMGDIAYEEESNKVRGILVAERFDSKAKSAARMIPDLILRKYAVKFSFSEGDE